ncbi:secretin and TonB N-terminal domain-containing protein [Rhizobacter sp. AJA081-3]|uniref:secretin and TonB N-terminal domain-containing protein n=1 Tax=Rhizobacter sp. AJA081-3 TaxID=2753607 RepID=UPI001AE093B9|nr:secretin and TonB N-terminal domain-containing protein [Rhizobacter sp. AJA081-3]QTN25668.1 secretin and TonB N-terminal domain-containing protein [Rhizobacter sp. AJA081-3]
MQSYREGQSELAKGKLEPGISKLKQAVEQDPQNVEFRRAYFTEREQAINGLLQQAEVGMESGSFDAARAAYQQVLRLDAANARALGGANRVDVAQRQWSAIDAAVALARNGDTDNAITKVRQVISENPNHSRANQLLKQLMRQQADRTGKELGIYPKLKAAYRTPVSLSFSNAPLLQVFDSLKVASGLNYVFDKEVRQDLRVTLSVNNKPVEDILRLLLATNQLERRILDEDTLLIYPNTPAKAAEYREMVVRTFYLSNGEASKVAGLLRTIAKVKDVVVDEKLNLIVVRDSAEVIRLAEKLIAAQDMAEPEVMLELEVLEVSVNRLLEMGISWPSSVSASVSGAAGVAGQLTLNELRNRTSDMVKLQTNDPLIAAQLRSQKGSANLLANPRVRVRNKQPAKILIGERVPVFTTTATANVGTSESVNYLDVGLKLEIEPTVSLDDEVSMKLALEVSNILETITRASGTQAYRLGTRNTSTTLRVRDGETNILAGLIQRDERRSNTGIPGLNEAPLISKLFGAAQDSDSRTEIVLLVTPRIVRNIELPGVGLQEFLSGTDASTGAAPIQLGTPGARQNPVPTGMPPGFAPGTVPPPVPMLQPPGGIPQSGAFPTTTPLPPSALPPGVQPIPPTGIQPPASPVFTAPPLVPTSPR